MLTQKLLKELFVLTNDGQLLRKKSDGQLIERKISKDKDGYILNFINGKLYREHRLIWLYVNGEMPKGILDHINRVKSDNRIENLRVVNHSENKQNTTKQINNKSGFKGVWLHKNTKKWCSSIQANKKNYHLGSFLTKEEAYEAYKNAAKKLHKTNAVQ